MHIGASKKPESIPLKHYGWLLIGIWTLVAAASLGWNLLQDRAEALIVARHIALTNCERERSSSGTGPPTTEEFMSR